MVDPSLTVGRKRAMICVFFVANLSVMTCFFSICFVVIFFFFYQGYLGKRAVSALTLCNITALTSVVCRIRFNKRIKFSCGQKLVFLYEDKSRVTLERYQKNAQS